MFDMRKWLVRVPDDLADAIDARVETVGEVSRNEWLIRALRWAVDQPVTTRKRDETV